MAVRGVPKRAYLWKHVITIRADLHKGQATVLEESQTVDCHHAQEPSVAIIFQQNIIASESTETMLDLVFWKEQ